MEKKYFLLTEAERNFVDDNLERFHRYRLDRSILSFDKNDLLVEPIVPGDFVDLDNLNPFQLSMEDYEKFNLKTKIDFIPILVDDCVETSLLESKFFFKE